MSAPIDSINPVKEGKRSPPIVNKFHGKKLTLSITLCHVKNELKLQLNNLNDFHH